VAGYNGVLSSVGEEALELRGVVSGLESDCTSGGLLTGLRVVRSGDGARLDAGLHPSEPTWMFRR